MDDYTIFYPLIIAVVGLVIGYSAEGNSTPQNPRSPKEKFWHIIKWLSIIVIALYVLIIVGAMTDGIGDIPLLGGAYWVRGHWRRYPRY
ncbi:MAG: hypothetical protein ABSF55_00400 [Candidatus Staskawiczbacteria bacterium]|jgi:cell division protein FtsW (lipid II flippase)